MEEENKGWGHPAKKDCGQVSAGFGLSGVGMHGGTRKLTSRSPKLKPLPAKRVPPVHYIF